MKIEVKTYSGEHRHVDSVGMVKIKLILKGKVNLFLCVPSIEAILGTLWLETEVSGRKVTGTCL